MHVLHRPQPPRVIAVTVIAAMLAIALTVAIARVASNHVVSSVPAVAPIRAAALQSSAARSGPGTSPFVRSPFSNLLTAPVTQPWTQDSRSIAGLARRAGADGA